ncbi:hypothetical protein N2152v2_007204 [Parachlorella kessleri]
MRAFLMHQPTAARISLAEEARTLVDSGGFGVLSTLSSKASEEGFPAGAVVEYVADEQGHPVFAFSDLSAHTGDVKKDGRCSLTVLADGFKGMDAARVNLKGEVAPILDREQRDAVRQLYLQRHPGSYWVDFGDFTWFRMDRIAAARVVGGFGRAGKVGAEEYLAAQPDPVAKFSGPVGGHMNKDHADSTRAMVKHYVGLTVSKATILSLDRLGMNLVVEKEGHDTPFKLRLPFPRPATDRKSIKDIIVEMTQAAAAAGVA